MLAVTDTTMGTRLRSLRERAGLTQTELAQRSGVEQTVISRVESGRTKSPSVSTMRALADALGVSLARLTGGEVLGAEGPRAVVNDELVRALFRAMHPDRYSVLVFDAARRAASEAGAALTGNPDDTARRLLEAANELVRDGHELTSVMILARALR